MCDTLDVNIGTVLDWIKQFSSDTGADTAGWKTVPWGPNCRVEQIPSRKSAERLAAFLRVRYPVMTAVYEPMGKGYEVPVIFIR